MLRTLFSPLLNSLDKGDQPFSYKPSHRYILAAVGALFSLLALVSLYFSASVGGFGFLLPVVVFLSVGGVCLVVAGLGSDRAVARIWGSR